MLLPKSQYKESVILNLKMVKYSEKPKEIMMVIKIHLARLRG